jgi:hypothetical protein
MKNVADWIRTQTPGWTDEERYKTILFSHNLLQPGTIACFIWGSPWLRFVMIVLHVIVIFTQIVYRDCLIYRVEREFTNKKIKTMVSRFLQLIGLDTITRGEKSMFTAGLNTGVLVMVIILLLQESLLWTVGFAAIVFIVPPILMWSSTILPPLKTVAVPPKNDLVLPEDLPSSQTLPHVSEKRDSTDETESPSCNAEYPSQGIPSHTHLAHETLAPNP